MMNAPAMPNPKLCQLQYTVGRVEDCPEGACPFWEPGGAALQGRCAVEDLDLSGRPEVAAWLLRIRKQLEAADTREEEEQARHLFYQLLNTGDADGG
jgi:hypothetical protein